MKANDHILVEHAVFKKEFEKLCKKVAEIMDVLSEEERDMVLEEHRIQLQQLEKEVTKKSTKKRKK